MAMNFFQYLPFSQNIIRFCLVIFLQTMFMFAGIFHKPYSQHYSPKNLSQFCGLRFDNAMSNNFSFGFSFQFQYRRFNLQNNRNSVINESDMNGYYWNYSVTFHSLTIGISVVSSGNSEQQKKVTQRKGFSAKFRLINKLNFMESIWYGSSIFDRINPQSAIWSI